VKKAIPNLISTWPLKNFKTRSVSYSCMPRPIHICKKLNLKFRWTVPLNGELFFPLRTFTVRRTRQVSKNCHRIVGKRTGFLISYPLMWRLSLLIYANRPDSCFCRCIIGVYWGYTFLPWSFSIGTVAHAQSASFWIVST
jgi:hypothetical protein